MSEFQVPVVTGPKPEEQNRIPVPSLSMPKAPEQAQRGLSAVTEPDAVAKSDEQPGMPPKDSADAVVEAIETPIQAGAAAAVHEGMRETPVGRAGLAAEEQRDAVAVAKSEQPRPVVAPGLNPQELREAMHAAELVEEKQRTERLDRTRSVLEQAGLDAATATKVETPAKIEPVVHEVANAGLNTDFETTRALDALKSDAEFAQMSKQEKVVNFVNGLTREYVNAVGEKRMVPRYMAVASGKAEVEVYRYNPETGGRDGEPLKGDVFQAEMERLGGAAGLQELLKLPSDNVEKTPERESRTSLSERAATALKLVSKKASGIFAGWKKVLQQAIGPSLSTGGQSGLETFQTGQSSIKESGSSLSSVEERATQQIMSWENKTRWSVDALGGNESDEEPVRENRMKLMGRIKRTNEVQNSLFGFLGLRTGGSK